MTTSSDMQPPIFRQGPRDFRPLPEGKITIPGPGSDPGEPSTDKAQLALSTTPMAAGMVVAAAINPAMAVATGVMMVAGLPLTLYNYRKQMATYQAAKSDRLQRYGDLLVALRQDLTELRSETQNCLIYNDPDIPGCVALAHSRDPRRLWSRIANDHDFLRVRLGLGELPFQVTVTAPQPQDPLRPDPLEKQAQSLVEEFATVPDVPVPLDLRRVGVAGIAGEREASIATLRTLVLQLAAHHSPEAMRLALVFPESETEQWAWARWLPHIWSGDRQLRYLAGERRAVGAILESLTEMLKQRESLLKMTNNQTEGLVWPTVYVVALADASILSGETRRLLCGRGPELGVYSIFLGEREAQLPRECRAVVTTGPETSIVYRNGEQRHKVAFQPEEATVASAEEFSRLLAPLQVESTGGSIPNLVTLFGLFEKTSVDEWDILHLWQESDPTETMAVPVGLGAGGRPLYFDLHDDGQGPHGLVAGTSGSGKTRFLECLVAILAAHFHPHELGFFFVDYKGTDFLQTIPDLPHCLGVMSNIEGKSPEEQNWYAARVLKGLMAEAKRRQGLFGRAKVNKISEYHKRIREGEKLEPIPRLVILVDEFAELAKQQPDFLDGLVSTARIGRSLGMHLILATQQPSGIVTDQIWVNSRFRISLKFNRVEDSQAVLQRPEAAFIEQRGRGYLQVGQNEQFELFQGPYGQAPYEDTKPGARPEDDKPEVIRVALNGRRLLLPTRQASGPRDPRRTQLTALVQQIKQQAAQAGIRPLAHIVPDSPDATAVLDGVRGTHGWNGKTWAASKRWMQPVIGYLDAPSQQRILPLEPDLGDAGHLFICSNSVQANRLPLQTLLASLALDHSPSDLHIYGLDFGSLTMRCLQGLPHVGAVIRANEPRRVNRLFRWLLSTLETRKEILANYGTSLADARKRGLDLDLPAIVFVIDNLLALKDDMDRKDDLARLAAEGGPVGIHVVLAGESRAAVLFSSTLANVPARLALGLGSRVEFRDVVESLPADLLVLSSQPNRGVYHDVSSADFECYITAPSAGATPDEMEKGLEQLASQMAAAATKGSYKLPAKIGDLASEMRLEQILPGDIKANWLSWSGYGLRAPVGQDDETLDPLFIDALEDGPHFVVVGPQKSGKTTALLAWVLSIAASVPPGGVRFVLFDNLKNTLEPLKDLPHVDHYVQSEAEKVSVLKALRERLDNSDAVLSPPVVVVIDDLPQVNASNVRGILKDLVEKGWAGRGLSLVTSESSMDMTKKEYGGVEEAILKYRSGFFVGSKSIAEDADYFGLNLPFSARGERLPRGRGYFARQQEYRMLQLATPGGVGDTANWVARITEAANGWQPTDHEAQAHYGNDADASKDEE